jgi:hypothetical protein
MTDKAVHKTTYLKGCTFPERSKFSDEANKPFSSLFTPIVAKSISITVSLENITTKKIGTDLLCTWLALCIQATIQPGLSLVKVHQQNAALGCLQQLSRYLSWPNDWHTLYSPYRAVTFRLTTLQCINLQSIFHLFIRRRCLPKYTGERRLLSQ